MSEAKTQKMHSPELKAKVSLEALRKMGHALIALR